MFKNKLKPNFGVGSLILIAVCIALVTTDLLTKYYSKLQMWDVKIIPGWVELDGSVPNNQGCAFSFLNENPQIGQPLLITLTVLMLVFLIGAFVFMPERMAVLKTAVTFVIAGAVGNLADRCAYRSVRDFFGLNMLFNGGLVYCNLADFFIVIGAILAVIDLLFLNEFAVFPLTKRAKAAQAERKREAPETSTDTAKAQEASVNSEDIKEDIKEEIGGENRETPSGPAGNRENDKDL